MLYYPVPPALTQHIVYLFFLVKANFFAKTCGFDFSYKAVRVMKAMENKNMDNGFGLFPSKYQKARGLRMSLWMKET